MKPLGWQISGVGESIDKDTIARLKKEMEELKENFERERKEIEQSYKLEIAAVEGKHDEEKGDILKNIEKDKVLYSAFITWLITTWFWI